jgi:Zn-dependent protease
VRADRRTCASASTAEGGGAVNVLFTRCFQEVATGHFVVKRLEQNYGPEAVRAVYERLAIRGAGVAWAAWLVGAGDAGPMIWLWLVGAAFTEVNLVLMFLKFIPIPPLDGSSVLPLFFSNRGLYLYYRLQRYAFPLLIALLWGVPALFQVDPIGAYFRHTVDPLFNLLVPR